MTQFHLCVCVCVNCLILTFNLYNLLFISCNLLRCVGRFTLKKAWVNGFLKKKKHFFYVDLNEFGLYLTSYLCYWLSVNIYLFILKFD
jgi:hypothetical protein